MEKRKLFELIGEATMCWTPIPSGVFDSTRCEDVGSRIWQMIKEAQLEGYERAIKDLEGIGEMSRLDIAGMEIPVDGCIAILNDIKHDAETDICLEENRNE